MSEHPVLRVVGTTAEEPPVSFDEGLPEYQKAWKELREMHVAQMKSLANMAYENLIPQKQNYYEVKRSIRHVREYAKEARAMERKANEAMEIIERIVKHERDGKP